MTSPLVDVGAVNLKVTVDGVELPDDYQLLQVRVQLGLRAVGRCTLVFVDENYAVVGSGKLNIGKAVSVAAGYDDLLGTVFEGTVTSVASEVDAYRGATLTVTVQDLGYELLRDTNIESFTNISYKDIVSRLVQEVGLSIGTIDLPTAPVKYALRNDTALGLIDEIAQRTGRDWCISGRTFSMWSAVTGSAPGARPVSITVGKDIIAFSARQVGDGDTKVTVRGWDPVAQSAVVGTSTTPTSRAGFDVSSAGAPKYTRVDARAATRSQSDATTAAVAIAARTGRVVATGKVQYTALMVPGGRVTVGGAGPSNGNYYVREVTSTWMDGTAITRFVAGDRDPVQLSDPWETTAPVSSFRRTGLAVGIVDNVKDPDGMGRVSVSLATASDAATTTWARVLGLGAGAGRGQVVLPEVGDEVLIGFEDDDVTRPVVLGGLYGSKSTTPTAAVDQNGAVVTRALTSRLGHVLEMSDGTAPATQHVVLAAAGLKHSLRIGKDRADLKVPDGTPLKITAGSSFIEFDGRGGITIDATTVTIKAKTKVETSAVDIDTKATGALKLQGTQASLKGTGMGVVEAGGILEVKGAMVKIN
ncbi:phage baseplate assembly protein V [Cellulomonas terrae]|uniref:Type IV secretion protein Rhs n=1 Tax=Cellulomonas terrae TaxID=311234 RepID=A0A511JKB0_9CELL|nr:phage baseplate assembly protein V [Cellulomonas terrae]GEL98319.1 type IV secretion protein Rhs [Cellulomonas terrae]